VSYSCCKTEATQNKVKQETLPHVTRQHLLCAGAQHQKSPQLIARLHRPHTCGRTRIDVVAHLQLEILRHKANDIRKGEEHVFREAVLYLLPVFLQVEFDIGQARKLIQADKITDYGGAVEGFSQFPGLPFGFELRLDIPGGEVDAERNFFDILQGKLGLYVAAIFADLQHDFSFEVQIFGKLGIIKRFAPYQ